jgi:uroporphyrin-III C-methyltransferase
MITGHDATGDVTGIDWKAVAKGAPVLVIYMAIKHLGRIAAELMAGGRSPGEPVALVSNASTPEQRVLETVLSRCADDVAVSGLAPPAIVVVGEVVKLRGGLDWLGASGGRVLDPDPLSRVRRDETG